MSTGEKRFFTIDLKIKIIISISNHNIPNKKYGNDSGKNFLLMISIRIKGRTVVKLMNAGHFRFTDKAFI